MPAARLRALSAVLALLWGLLVWELCTSTRVSSGRWFWWTPWAFNLAHAPLFGVLAALLGLALRAPAQPARGFRGLLRAVPDPDRERGPYLLAAAAALAYGVALEWVQSGIPGRRASSLDVLLDAVGAFGVPWALASGAVFGRRFWPVLAAGAALSAWATWGAA